MTKKQWSFLPMWTCRATSWKGKAVMKWILGMAAGLVLLVAPAWGGNMDSPGTPPLEGSGLYPLQALYDYLDSGAAPSLPTTFQGPTAAPGSTGKTTNEIYEHIRGMFEVCDATPDDVVDTATFFSTDPANWGPRQGGMASQTLDPENKEQRSGFYGAFDLSEVDTDLSEGNIRSGATIFGIPGDSNVVDTSSGDAAAGDILSGKTAWVGGNEVIGALATREPDSESVEQAAGLYDAFNLSTVDSDLNSANIRAGATIFGISGSETVVDTAETTSPATAAQILEGRRAFVEGTAVTGTMPIQTLSDATTEVLEGFYTLTDMASVDTDLTTENIKSGTTIFGISGDPNVVDTSSGDAGAGDILIGKKAWVDGTEVTGTSYPAPVAKISDGGNPPNGVSWPNPRFTDNFDGTVTDNLTGLIWLKDGNCFGTPPWTFANDLCHLNLEDGLCGLSDNSEINDWRLPNIKELLSLVIYDSTTPILPTPFSAPGLVYWSSTSGKSLPSDTAYSVDFFQGISVIKNKFSDAAYVLAVRDAF